MRSKIAAFLAAIFVVALPALLIAQVPNFPQTLPPNTVVGRLGTGPGPSQAIPFSILRTQLGLLGSTSPKIQRFSAISTTFTPDNNTTLVRVWLQGAGGGGQGSVSGNPKVPLTYAQYGRIGTPSAFDTINIAATISQASPGIITAVASNAHCNDPFYLTTTGTLPSPYLANTVYYVQCGNDGNPAPTANTFAGSLVQYQTPLTCAVYAPFCQNPINTSTPGSGTHTLHLYNHIAQAGSGGGIIGDQAVPGSYVRCDFDATWPAGYQQGYGLTGGTGGNLYGINISDGPGAGTPTGPGPWATGGLNAEGTGGAGAFGTLTGSGGGGGGGGGWCYFAFRPTPNTSYPMLCGTGGTAGASDDAAVTITNGSPGTINYNNHPYGPNSKVRFTGSLGTGLVLATDYFVYGPSIATNSFQVSATVNGARINLSGSWSNVHVTSGTAGFPGGHGQCVVEQSYGLN